MRALIVPLPWHDPVDLFERTRSLPAPLLLESAGTGHAIGRCSFLSADPVATVRGPTADWPAIRDRIRATLREDAPFDPALPPFQGGWAGWFGYELGTAFDRMPVHADPDARPDVSLALYDWVIAWDHEANRCWLISSGIDATGTPDAARAEARRARVLAWLAAEGTPLLSTSTGAPRMAPHRVAAFADAGIPVHGDFTRERYQEGVARVVEYIRAGDIFQANLTQRFTAPFGGSLVALYRALRARTPAPMSALIGDGADGIASASPERFLRYDPRSRRVETRPIKGTARRGADDDGGAALLGSAKDRAENVMIVDLLRNDLARVCDPGSVAVPSLCALERHPTVYHLVSTVTGRLSPGHDALDLLAATFPGGSISGAPKLRATEILAGLEPVRRGVYCGAIGWIGLDGGMDTSIAIRTIVCADGVATFHAGGGITAQSDPAAEYQETLDKAAALVAALAEAT